MSAHVFARRRPWLLGLALALCLQAPATLAYGALRPGTNVWPGYEPLYLARSLGYLDQSLGYLDQSRVRLIEYPSASQVIRAFRNGPLEMAALTLDEVLLLRTRLLKGGARELFRSREIPGEIVDMLVARAGTADRHSRAIEHLVRGWFRALEFLQAQPNEAAMLMSERLRLGPADLLRSFDGSRLPGPDDNVELLGAPSATLLPVARRLGDVLLEQELLSAPAALDDLLAPAAVNSLAR